MQYVQEPWEQGKQLPTLSPRALGASKCTRKLRQSCGSKGVKVDNTSQTAEPVIATLIRLRRFWKHPTVLGASWGIVQASTRAAEARRGTNLQARLLQARAHIFTMRHRAA